jgi:arylsulfatase A-like enzyme
VPDDIQGRSLVPILKGNTPKDWRTTFYYHYYEFPGWHDVRRHYGVTDGRYKLIRFYEPDVNEWELYDLKTNPHEMQSVYGKSQYASIQAGLKKELSRQRRVLEVPQKDPPASLGGGKDSPTSAKIREGKNKPKK